MLDTYRKILQNAIYLLEDGEYQYCCNAIDRAAADCYCYDIGVYLTNWINNALDGNTFSIYIEQRYGIDCRQSYRVEFLNWLMQNLHVVKNKDHESWKQHMSFIKNRTQHHVE